MATKIILLITGDREEGKSQALFVQDTYDQVIERLVPVQQPSSSLEARGNMQYTDTDGNRLWIPPNNVGYVHENQEPTA